MLDFFYILTKGGLVLWYMTIQANKFIKIINSAIENIILHGHGNEHKWISNISSHQIHYRLDDDFEIIFILGYRKTLNISYADKFLDEIHKRFRDQYKNDLTINGFNKSFSFRQSYDEILFKIEEEEEEKVKAIKRLPRPYEQSNKKPNENFLFYRPIPSKPENTEEGNRSNMNLPIAGPRCEPGYLSPIAIKSPSNTSDLVNSLWSKLKKMNIFTSKILTSDDLYTGIEAMREHLISKNVAADVAEKICESISIKLIGKTLETFENLTKYIRQAMRDTLVMVLTPKQQIDILHNVANAQQANRPYIITFCGVNGVGKSTNLAKVAYWLCGNNLRILIAACDTFRSGAIEQLRTHVRSLNDIYNEKTMIELYERGYGKDAANVASQAIYYAKVNKFDVVLIDTAGRMENDKPLMKALAKLIHVNNPDLILFVGEALVGNSAVDQITHFNRALIDNTPLENNPRTIDGILLTKFDTVDDKVGAAISMVYTTGKPIVFVGTGQQRQDLKIINADVITDALLK